MISRTDLKEKNQFLVKLTERVNTPDHQDAWVFATTAVANVYPLVGETAQARTCLDESEKALDLFNTVETVIHASFYRVNAYYYQSKDDFMLYYKKASSPLPTYKNQTSRKRSKK